VTGLLARRFIAVAGKGGTGRTTLSFALARLAARQGRRVLLCLASPGSRHGQLPGLPGTPGVIAHQGGGLHVLEMDPMAAMDEYGRMMLKSRTLHRLVFANRHVRHFLDAVPGLSEWAVLGKATWHMLDRTPAAQRFDTVVFDSPATGHGLDMLRLPAAIVRSVPAGRMREEAKERLALLQDPATTAIIPVTIPEEGPVNEALELLFALQAARLPVPLLVVNRIIAPPPDVAFDFTGPAPEWARPLLVQRMRWRLQEDSLARLKNIGLPVLPISELESEGGSVQTFEGVTAALSLALGGAQASQARGVQARS